MFLPGVVPQTPTEVGKRNRHAQSLGNPMFELKQSYTLLGLPLECLTCASQISRAS